MAVHAQDPWHFGQQAVELVRLVPREDRVQLLEQSGVAHRERDVLGDAGEIASLLSGKA